MLFSSRRQLAQTKRPTRGQFRPRLEALEDRCVPATFAVLTNADFDVGALTLRQAILLANSTPNVGGPDIITFNLAVPTIGLQSPLPAITEAVIIDGTTQPGYAGSPLVQLDGAGAGSAAGLIITAPNSTVRGLVINRFSSDAIRITGAAATGNLVEKNYLGTNVAGTAALGNGQFGVRIENAANNKVAGNLISGNGIHGIIIYNPGASGNVVQGNHVGTNVSGNAPLPNLLSGVVVQDGAHDNRIGTDGNGISDAAERNIISGNHDFGVAIWRNVFDPTATTDTHHNIVAGNTIGLAPDGTTELGNGQDGVWINNARDNTIGGDTAAERNVISGNGTIPGIGRGQNGVVIFNPAATGNVVIGNYIGTDATGALARPNRGNGVSIQVAAHDNRIGTVGNEADPTFVRNVISGNGANGVSITGLLSSNVVRGNYIGIDRSGAASLGNAFNGVFIDGASGNIVGGATAAARNVVSANGIHGITILHAANINIVQGNYVGANAAGAATLGNALGGVVIDTGPAFNVVGTDGNTVNDAFEGNLIAGNHDSGVIVNGTGATRNSIRGNAIYANGDLGIDLGNDGTTPNDAGDADLGPNNLQNFPVLSPIQAGATTGVAGSLNSLANATFTLDFYVNVAAGPSGSGESQRYLGSTFVTTDASGHGSFGVQLAAGTIPGQVITATATDAAGNTSEFSAAVLVGPPLFDLQRPFGVGSGPESVAVGDFDRDGNLDIAAANSSGNVSVLLGDGAGGFGAVADFAVGSNPKEVVVADFNRDGMPDLATANFTSDSVGVLLGDGAGRFGPVSNFPVGFRPNSVAVGDFNRDGNPDLATANFGATTVSVLRGDGLGGFGPPATFQVGTSPASLAVADFNRDGTPDLAVANFGSEHLSVLLGNGAGGFHAAANPTAGTLQSSVAVGDFNRDGIPDLVAMSTLGNEASVLLGNGSGGFGPATKFGVGHGPNSVAVEDFNRDGNLDLAVAATSVNNVSVLLGNGSGRFGAAAAFAVGDSPRSVALGDFNRDGALDLITANEGPDSVSLLLNRSPVTTTQVSSDASPSVVGQLVTFAATVTPDLSGVLKPTGIVRFMDGTNELGTGTLDVNGRATLSTFALTTGYHTIRAVYQGDPNFTGSTAPIFNQLVNQSATTTTTLTSSANPWILGEPITFTATVSGYAPGFGPPRGSVLFMDKVDGQDETMTIAAVALDEDGVATFTTTALAAGGHSLRAVYVGANPFTGSTSPLLTQAVTNPVAAITALSPASLPEGTLGFTLLVTGEHFLSGSTVTWNGTPLTVTAVSATEIHAKVPAALLVRVGAANVVVSNPGPGGGDSIAKVFSITNAPLTVLPVHLNVIANKNFSGPVATFTDGNPFTTAADFKAIITWPDGDTNDSNNKSDFGTITGAAGGTFTVAGGHNFGAFANLRTVKVTILDRDGYAVTVIDNVIDPPAPDDGNVVNPPSIIVPLAQRTQRNTILSLAGSRRIALPDDAANRMVRMTLTATHGALALRTTAGLIRVRGNGTANVTMTGSVQKINKALNGLRYQPTPGFRGKARLTIFSQDLDAASGAEIVSRAVLISVV